MISTFISILLALAISLTFLGKSIIGIVMGVCVIISAFFMIKNYALFFNRNRLCQVVMIREIIAIIIMIILWGLSAYQGIRPDISLEKTVEFFSMIIGGIIIFCTVNQRDFQWNVFFVCTTFMAAVAGLIMIIKPYGLDLGIEFRSSYGSVMAIIMPLAFYLMMIEKTACKYIWWICGFFIVAGIFASDGRTSWVGFIVFIIMAGFLMPIGQLKKRIPMMGLFVCVSIAAASFGFQSYKDRMGDEYFQNRVENMMSSDRVGSGRLIIWDETLTHIIEKPLLGYGIRAARFLDIKNADDENATVIHVHNAILEIALETGLLGLVAFIIVILIFVFGFLRAYVHSLRHELKPKAMAIFLSCVVYGVCSMMLTSIFHTWWFLYLVVLLILLKKAELELSRK
jgi:O-antigen ligase